MRISSFYSNAQNIFLLLASLPFAQYSYSQVDKQNQTPAITRIPKQGRSLFIPIKGQVTKEDVRSMLLLIKAKARSDFENEKNPIKQSKKIEEYFHLSKYLNLFEKTSEKDLWINTLEFAGTCARRNKEGQIIVYPMLNQALCTEVWNNIQDKNIQKLFKAIVLKENVHIRYLLENTEYTSQITQLYQDFNNELNKSGIGNGKKDKDTTPDLQEQAKWLLGVRLHEEFIGYHYIVQWLKENGLDVTELKKMASNFDKKQQLQLKDLCIHLINIVDKCCNNNGELDEKKFEKIFLEGLFVDNPNKGNDSSIWAARVVQLANNNPQNTEKGNNYCSVDSYFAWKEKK